MDRFTPLSLESDIYCIDASVETNYRKSLILPPGDAHIKLMGDMLLQKKQKEKQKQIRKGNETRENILIALM